MSFLYFVLFKTCFRDVCNPFFGPNMTDLLIVSPPPLHLKELDRPWTSTPLHLMYSYLRAQGIDVEVFDVTAELGLPSSADSRYLNRMEQALSRFNFKVAGVSCWASFQYLGSMEVGRILRSIAPQAPILVGGWHPTVLPSDFESDNTPFDLIVRGAGEKILLEICRNPIRPSCIRQVWGEPVLLSEIEWDWTYPYTIGSIFLSRGCPHSCLYCQEHWTYKELSDLEHALRQYHRALEHSKDYVTIQDAIFGVNPRWRREFLQEVSKISSGPAPALEVRADQLDFEDVELLAKARAIVYFGFETASEKMLTIMQKTKTPAQYVKHFLKILDLCDQHGVQYMLGTLFNHPGETRQTLQENLDFFDRFITEKPHPGLVVFVDHTYTYYPGSRFDLVAEKFSKEHGARIHFPDYWRHPKPDHRAQSRAVTASWDLPYAEAKRLIRRFNAITFHHRTRKNEVGLEQV